MRQYAESLFLGHALFATRGRTGLLVLVSLFERRIEIIADTGFTGRVTPAEWQDVIARMTPHLRNRRPFEALREALGAIETLLTAKGFSSGGERTARSRSAWWLAIRIARRTDRARSPGGPRATSGFMH